MVAAADERNAKRRRNVGGEELKVPAVGAGEAVSGERLFEVALSFFESARIVERLDALAAVDINEAQLEGAGLHLTRFIPDVVVPALEPPEHGFFIGRWRAPLQQRPLSPPLRREDAPRQLRARGEDWSFHPSAAVK